MDSTFPWTYRKFNHIDSGAVAFAQPLRIDSDTGPRIYRTPEGEEYPSVTSVFEVLDHSYLDRWRERVGIVEAERISKEATDNGTKIHSMCEDYLNNAFDASKYNPMMLDAFIPLAQELSDHVENVHSTELMMYSDRLRVAGTTDLIAEYDGVRSIIDFKTARRAKRRSDIPSYFMQGAAYAAMAYEKLGIPLRQIVILMLVQGEGMLVFKERVEDHLPAFIRTRRLYKERYGI